MELRRGHFKKWEKWNCKATEWYQGWVGTISLITWFNLARGGSKKAIITDFCWFGFHPVYMRVRSVVGGVGESPFMGNNGRHSQGRRRRDRFLRWTDAGREKKRRKNKWKKKETQSGTHPTRPSAGCGSWRREPSWSRPCEGPPARWSAAASSWAPRDPTPGTVGARSPTCGSSPPCPRCSWAPSGGGGDSTGQLKRLGSGSQLGTSDLLFWRRSSVKNRFATWLHSKFYPI